MVLFLSLNLFVWYIIPKVCPVFANNFYKLKTLKFSDETRLLSFET